MSLTFYLDKPSYNHSIDFFWLPYNLGPVLCSTFCRFGWRFEEGHERWEANYYWGMRSCVMLNFNIALIRFFKPYHTKDHPTILWSPVLFSLIFVVASVSWMQACTDYGYRMRDTNRPSCFFFLERKKMTCLRIKKNCVQDSMITKK